MSRKAREIPWLEPNDAGTYYVHWYDSKAGRTKRLSLKTADKTIAQGLYAEFLSEKAAVQDEPPPSVMTVAAVLDYYHDEHVVNNVVDKVRPTYAIAALKEFFGEEPISAIDKGRCQDFARHRFADDYAPATVRKELITLQSAANFCYEARRITDKDLPRYHFPPNTPARCDKWLTKDQFSELHDAAVGRAKKFIWLAYWTAGRKTAVGLLTKDRVDFVKKQIDLHPPENPRTKKRNAVVHIAGPLAAPLAEWCVETPNDYVLGEPGVPESGFDAAVRKAGLESLGVSPHWLRHSRASHMLQDDVPIVKVARLLGDTVAMVDRVYGHLTPESMADV
jgi:integrase